MLEQTSNETYETLYTRLQDVVARLETGELPLEEALQLYEQGVQLAAACQHLLDTAELRVQQVQLNTELETLDDT
jgi:exodeoxyribonuclease VII small subunit